MRQSESIANLAAALVKAQREMENATKNADNPHLGSKYANLEEVLRVTKPVLASHGLAVLQMPGMEGDSVTLETMLVHESGEWIAGVACAPLPVGRTNRKGEPVPVGAQDVGSAITYLRRYGLAALAGITQEDNDGAGVGTGGPQFISEFQAKDIHDRLRKTGANLTRFLVYMKVQEVEKIPAAKYEEAVRALEQKAQENGQAKAAGKVAG